MKRTRLVFTLSLVCMAASSSIGQAIAEDSQSPSPTDELGTFVGDGTCIGNLMAMGKSPGHATTGKYHGEKTLDGHWVVIRYDEDKSDVNPKPFHVQQYLNYDRSAAQKIHTGMMRNQKGDWVKTDEETCKSS
jgi:hypothetical protein